MMPYNVRNAGGGSVGGILRRTGHASSSSSTILSNGNIGTGTGTGTAGGSSSSLNLENHRQTPLELLVFGYACKIFRDDEKAREMDHGKQLIPWMGDVNLKIDRYDVRGALCELAPHEAPPGGYGNRLEYLSAEEQRAEQLCEEERYLFLYNNEEELRLRQEEDLKRLQQETSGGNYSQVGFQYDGQSAASASTAPSQLSPTSEENELPFVLPYTLMMVPPLGMQLPETMKQHAIIEKTARFIATQGAQMEILIKAKQANNNQFDFLTQGGHLQPYYRHLLAAIKAAKFPPAPEATLDQQQTADQESNQSTNDVNSEDGAGGRRNSNQVVITVPTIKYKPSANCAYTQLISKIKGVPLQAVLLEDESSNPGNSQHSGTDSPTPSCRSEGHNSQGGGEFTPVLLQYNGSTFTHEAETQDDNENNSREPPQVELLKNTSALALAQNYSSESDDEEEEEPEKEPERKPEPVLTFPVPEESLRHIIDKTATYVIKNGRQFEETLRTKSVERFSFLLPANEFYAYYLYKVTGDVDAASKEEKTRKAAAVAAALMSKKGLSFGGAAAAAVATGNNLDKAPVSFSIRARDEHGPLQPTLPQETSDEEASSMSGGGEQVRPGMPDSVQRAIKQVETQLLARTAGQKASAAPSSCSSPQKEQRQAEERVKDKLAQIAREKLNGMISREKQLQLERKRKAMAFLNQIKGEGATVGSAVSGAAPNPPEPAAGACQSAAGESDNESNDESVRSIPITFFGPDDDDEVGDDQKKPEVRLEREAQEDEEDDEEDEDDNGDLEKYNLLNDDSTNTFTSNPVPSLVAPPPPAPPPAPAPAVLLSDDDDVQLVATSSSSRSSRSRPRKMPRRSMSRSRNGRSRSSRTPSSASSRESSHRRRQKSSKPSKEPSSSSLIAARKSQSQSQTAQRRKGSPKKRRRSKSRSRSRSHRRSRSRSSISRANRRSKSRSFSGGSREAEHRQRQQQQRRRTPTKKSHKRHKRRRRSSSP
ncbi:hypothetical protein KR084_006470 [Drosophila pseudotakahashii]|nr:hypothetical protein KR084_006470 [Drosophila pseudotakahashii]